MQARVDRVRRCKRRVDAARRQPVAGRELIDKEMANMSRWFDGRVCLLGDAAHAMSPSAGQGASMAMEDALVLAQCLRDVDEPRAAFAAFEQRRRPRVNAIVRLARGSGSGKAVEGRLSEWLRDRMLPLFLRLGASAQTKHYAHRLSWSA